MFMQVFLDNLSHKYMYTVLGNLNYKHCVHNTHDIKYCATEYIVNN